jgi:acyl-coenzyme A thioesterase PaaI-like protein
MHSAERSIQDFLYDNLPLHKHIGLVVDSARNGVYRCHIPLSAENRNHFASVHAAVQWAGAEMLGGLVVLSNFDLSQLFVAVRSVSIQFLKPGRTGITAETRSSDGQVEEIRQELQSRGEADFRLHAVIRDDSNLVAETEAEYVVRKRESPAPHAPK